MPDTTANGVPYLELTDPPDIASGTQDIADWLDDNLGGGSAQQTLNANPAQPAKVEWKYPRARVSNTLALPPSGTVGDLWTPATGTDAGELYIHNGTAFARVKPNLAPYAKGMVDPDIGVGFNTKTSDQTISSQSTWTDVSDLTVTVTLAADRRYVVTVQAAVQIVFDAARSDATSEAFGQILVGGTSSGRWCHFGTDSPANGQSRYCLGYGATPPFVGSGSSTAIKAQIWRQGHGVVVDCASDFPGWIRVDDVGPADD